MPLLEISEQELLRFKERASVAINARLEPRYVEFWDALALAHGVTRTDMLRLLLSAAVENLNSKQNAPIDPLPPPLTVEDRERRNVTVQLEKYYVRLWDDYAHANRMNRTEALRKMILKLCRA